MNFTDKRVLVTGASRGIGQDIANGFAQAGAVVILCARSDRELSSMAARIRDGGGQAHALPCDVTDPVQVSQLAAAVSDLVGNIDVLINCAGVAGSHKFLTHPDELWHRMLAVNLTGVYYVTKAFAGDMMAQNWGRIINIASIAAKTGGKYIAAYAASKHGVLGLTRTLAVELAPQVTVNAICPAYVDTPMTEATITNIVDKTGMTREEARATLEETGLQQRLIQPKEITALTLHLAGEESRGITGQAINVDGGAVMW